MTKADEAVALPCRQGEVERTTKETQIGCRLTMDTGAASKITTGIPFFDHMLEQLAFHSGIALELVAKGDLMVDNHHTVEDVGLVLGEAFGQALGSRKGICRYGDATIPMDEVLCLCSVDLSGRPGAFYTLPFSVERIGSFETEALGEFLTAFARRSGITLHVRMLQPGNNHHMAEAVFKSLAVALSRAIRRSGVSSGVLERLPSTKGVMG